MGLFSGRGRASVREWTAYPDIPPNSANGGLPQFSNATPPRTIESAMRRVAVGSSVRLITGLISQLPRDCYRGEGDKRKEVDPPAFLSDPDGTGYGFDDWLDMGTMSWLLRGNVYGQILDFDKNARPSQILLFHPDDVSLRERDEGPEWRHKGKIVPVDQMWHKRAFPVPGKRLGMSPIAMHATQVLQGTAAEAFGARWFIDGAHPSAVLTNDEVKQVDKKDADKLKARFMAAQWGNREPAVLAKGWRYQQIQVSANESQFLDTQRYTSAECAKIFGPNIAEILGYDSGSSMTYTNIEQRSIDLLKFNLNRWLRKWEGVIKRTVMPPLHYMKFERAALLETDLVSRYRAHETALTNKFATINEVRAHEDRPPVSWGDEPVESTKPAAQPVTIKE